MHSVIRFVGNAFFLKFRCLNYSIMDFDTFLEDEEDGLDDADDDFLFESIQRYNTLQMFHLENVPLHLLQLDSTSLCVASKRNKGENSELLKLKLPGKLTLPPDKEGRSKENDFKVLSGIYTGNLVYQIDQLDYKIITSETNVNGLNIYSFTDSSLGNENQQQKIELTPWSESEFTLIQTPAQAVCSKCCHKPLILVDLSRGILVREIKHPFFDEKNIPPEDTSGNANPCCINHIKCNALSDDLIAVLNTHTGEVVLHDLRTEDTFISLPAKSKKLSEEVWTISDCDYEESSLNYFGIVSNASSFCIYDKRKNSVITENTGSGTPSDNNNMKLKFNLADKFSVSGMNSFVQIFRINESGFEHVFTHKGHSPSNLPSAVVTDHIWLPAGGKEYIVSICNNKTLNCWDFKA